MNFLFIVAMYLPTKSTESLFFSKMILYIDRSSTLFMYVVTKCKVLQNVCQSEYIRCK